MNADWKLLQSFVLMQMQYEIQLFQCCFCFLFAKMSYFERHEVIPEANKCQSLILDVIHRFIIRLSILPVLLARTDVEKIK